MNIKLRATFVIAAALAVAAPAGAQDLTGTLKKIKDTGTISIGHRESSIPFSYLDDKQQPVGYAMDLCMKIVDAVKAELKMPNLKVALQPVTSANRIPLMQNGTIDLECGSTTNSVERQKQVAFGPTYFVINVTAAVKKNSGIKSLAELNGKTISTTSGTTAVPLMKKYEKTASVDVKEIYGKDHAESMQLLATDRSAAFVMDDILLAGQIANQQNPGDYVIIHESLRQEPYSMMLRREDPQFKALVDRAVTPGDEVRRDRQDLRQVVHQPDSAAEHQPQLPADAAAQGSVRQPQRPRRAVAAGRFAGPTGAGSRRASGPCLFRQSPVRSRVPAPGGGNSRSGTSMNYNWNWGVFFQETPDGDNQYWELLVEGLGWTLAVSVVAWIIAMVIGSLVGTIRTTDKPWLVNLGNAWVELFRNIPLLVQMFLWYFVIPEFIPPLKPGW